MRYVSTRDAALTATLSQALERGIAPDGGLYVPETFPTFRPEDFDGAETLPAIAERLLAPFFAGDALEPQLSAILREAFDFPVPLVALGGTDDASVLELFHGPTAAFKDFGARFLAACFARLPRDRARRLTILVATSGDTGGAVAAAFHRRPGIDVVVLYPKGLVSPRQEQQLTCWGDNVRALRVIGTFDDCQALVKAAFADPQVAAQRELSSANSINVGRLLPQACYYALASLAVWRRTRRPANFIVPPATWATCSRASGRARSGSRSASSCSASMRIAPCRTISPRASGVPARASRRSRPRWTSATPATWNACDTCFRSGARSVRASRPRR